MPFKLPSGPYQKKDTDASLASPAAEPVTPSATVVSGLGRVGGFKLPSAEDLSISAVPYVPPPPSPEEVAAYGPADMLRIFGKSKPGLFGTRGLGGSGDVEVDESKLREFGDYPKMRSRIYSRFYDAVNRSGGAENETHSLGLSDVEWSDPDKFTKKQHKDASLKGESLSRRLSGVWSLTDKATGEVIDKRRQVIARVPYLTESGTFLNNGTEYAVRNQQRLKPGVYSRKKANGELESMANVVEGGFSHRYSMDPKTGVFHILLGQAKIPMLPLMRTLGATDDELEEAWGKDILRINKNKPSSGAIEKVRDRLLSKRVIDQYGGDYQQAIRDKFSQMKVDPEVMKRTLGHDYDRLGKDVLLGATKKLRKIHLGEATTDDRDQLAYQVTLGPEDMLAERILKDKGGLLRSLLYKAVSKKSLKGMPSSAFQSQIDAVVSGGKLGQVLQEINPMEMLDANVQISSMGDGGISSPESIPAESRNVNPTQFGFIDGIRTPESGSGGVELFLTSNTRKGEDGTIYSKVLDRTTGSMVWRNPLQLREAGIAFPGVDKKKTSYVPVVKDGELGYSLKKDVRYELPHFENAFSPMANMIPMKANAKGQRMGMGSRMLNQALSLINPESPLVQSAIPGTDSTESYDKKYGTSAGAIRSKGPGRVVDIADGNISVLYEDGTKEDIELYENHPYNTKSQINQTPMVRRGDRFREGDLLAKSNYTNDKGEVALGINGRVAFMSFRGLNFEDAIVISEGMADKLTSNHMYQKTLPKSDNIEVGKSMYLQNFGSRYPPGVLEKFDKNGLIRKGETVNYEDPLILATEVKPRMENKVYRKGQGAVADRSVTWDNEDPGVVTDVVQGRNGSTVVVKTQKKMRVADKLSNRYGGKGVISAIIPDVDMPKGADGRNFEVLLNPLGVISRNNPVQVYEMALSKIAEKQGKPFVVEDFSDVEDRAQWVAGQMRKHGIPFTEDIINPDTGRKIKGIFTGSQYMMKLHHESAKKGTSRGGGSYTQEGAPGYGSKRLSLLDMNSLISHGADEVMRDGKLVRGSQNDRYWMQFMQGHNPSVNKVPDMYKKFVAQLRASGINVIPGRDGKQTNIMAMANKDVLELTGDREIQNSNTVKFDDNLSPIKGGLFDPAITGSHNSPKWSKITLSTPMLNPLMEEPARRLLDLTGKKFRSVLRGEEPIGEYGSGPEAIKKALSGINLDVEIKKSEALIGGTNKGKRDQAIRKSAYLKSAKKLGLHPSEWVLDAVPVLPTQFRPVSIMSQGNVPLVADVNVLYKELFEANKNLKEMEKVVGPENTADEREAVYDAFSAVIGIGDPISKKSQEKGITGILKDVLGTSPKYSTVQRKLVGTQVDNVGRGVIVPDPDLDMDSIGIPEGKAFEAYSKFIVRRLVRSGMSMIQAMRQVKEKTPLAKKMLNEEMEFRPVIMNRAPVLHRFGILAFKPRLTKGSAIKISPLVVSGFNADFDGDTVNYQIPVIESARKQALEKMLPSKNLFAASDFKSPMHSFGQEYVTGLAYASGLHGKEKTPVKTFRSKKDVVLAYKRGEIGSNDNVEVLGED